MKSIEEYISDKIITEAFKVRDMDKAMSLFENILKKRVNSNLHVNAMRGYSDGTLNGEAVKSKQFIITDDNSDNIRYFQLDWLKSDNSYNIYSISFFRNLAPMGTGEGSSALTIYTNGSNFVRLIPVIINIINTNKYNISQADINSLGQGIAAESWDENPLHIIVEADYNADDEVKAYKRDLYKRRNAAYNNRKDPGSNYQELDDEYQELMKALKNGAVTMADVKMTLKPRVKITYEAPKAQQEYNQQAEENDLQDPDEIWADMEMFLEMLIKRTGDRNCLLITGGPGTGKSYRVKQTLRENGFKEGYNLKTVKAHVTPAALYPLLYNFQKEDDIIWIDDADNILNDEVCVNLLKAAADGGTEEPSRVSYYSKSDIKDEYGDPVPKSFDFKGGIIIITNYSMGKVDGALRSRSMLVDIRFTLAQVLDIIEGLLPKLSPDRLLMKYKKLTMDYFRELAADEKHQGLELSLRVFGTCAGIWQTSFYEMDEEHIKKCILRYITNMSDKRKFKN